MLILKKGIKRVRRLKGSGAFFEGENPKFES